MAGGLTVVHVTFDWDGFKGYAEHCRVGTYQVKQHEEGTEVRVKAGKLGYVAVYDREKPEQKASLESIVHFCKISGFILVEESISDELFHI